MTFNTWLHEALGTKTRKDRIADLLGKEMAEQFTPFLRAAYDQGREDERESSQQPEPGQQARPRG